MTLVCGYLEKNGRVWIGGDSVGVNGSFVVPARLSKLLRAGDWRVGMAGNWAANLPLERAADRLAACGGVGDLVFAILDVLKEAGFNDTKPPNTPGPADFAQEFLAARRDGIWAIEGDGSLVIPKGRFLAIGRAQDIAYGAAEVLLDRGPSEGREFITCVLEIGARFYASVGPPFWIECVE